MPGLPNLKTLRDSAGLTQQDLAKMADVTPATISYIETGRVVPNLDTLIRLAQALGVQPGDLLNQSAEGAA